MSVTDAAETNASSNGGWGSQSASSWDNSTNGANQWLVNSAGDKVACGSWAQAVSGDQSASSSAAAAVSASQDRTQQISNLPNNKSISSTQSDLIEENGSQINQHIASSQFDDLSDELYSTRWGSSVINHDNGWDLNSPSSANTSHSQHAHGANAAGGFKPLDAASLSNLGTELWHNNLRQTRELTNPDLLQSPGIQQPIEQADTQWKKLVAGTASHFGGTWGEEEDMSNVWTGIPSGSAAGSQANQLVANQLANNQTRSTSATSIFRQNSINCGKANAQLLSNNSNWISDDNENWGETIKAGAAEWENAPDISMLNSANSVSTPKSASDAADSWSFYPTANKLNPSAVVGNPVAAWSAADLADKAAASLADASVDDGTSLWGNPQGQNKVLHWKEKEEKARNSQAISNEQWKKYPLNSTQINNGKSNWNELMGEAMDSRGSVPGTPITTSTGLAWSSDNVDESDWAKNKRKLTKEMIASSSPFRILVEMGFKEEDVENSLRNSNMNLQESIEELRLNTLKETGVEIDRRKQQAQNSPVSIQQSLPSVNNMLRNISTNKLPNSTNLPSEKLLTNLVQQIQLAVQSGHLNAQILNQQLAPATVTLIHQLLQQIKMMQSLQSGVSKNYFQNSYQVSQCKQKISTLQKQINVQQALFFKQQQPMQAGNNGNGGRPAGMLGNNGIGSLANDLNSLQLNQASHSRLNQWKLPDNCVVAYQEALSNDFSRAPGPSSSKQQPPAQQFVLPNSWTNMSGGGEENWQQNLQTARAKEQQQLSSSAPQQQLVANNSYGEMVSDFTNKPMNSNPRAAFYAGAGKPEQMYNWSANKLDAGNENLANGSNSFNSNTWSFPANQAAQLSSAPQQNANIWNNSAAANSNKPKGPPPGLVQVKDQNHGFLLIRNLNLQIDESILKTLCRQHGSLLFFQMFLNHGIAIVKYASKEDAIKAQSALNHCSLGNTTIQVSLASESDVQQYLTNCQQQNDPPATIYNNVAGDLAGNLNSNMNSEYMIAANNCPWSSAPSMPNSSMWSFSQAPNNLWNIDQNASALQNLLPDNLLGESN